jgi:hypothetical protein
MTNFEEIYDLAKVTMNDYRLDNLAIRDYDAFLTYFRSLLVTGMAEFTGCLTSLDYTSVTEGNETKWYFTNDLSMAEKSILAKTIVLKWWEQNIQDVVVFQPHMSSKNFKQLQESQSLKQKSEYKDKLGEELSRAIVEYQMDNLSSLPFWGG